MLLISLSALGDLIPHSTRGGWVGLFSPGFKFFIHFYLIFYPFIFLHHRRTLTLLKTKFVLPPADCTLATVGGAKSCFIYYFLSASNHPSRMCSHSPVPLFTGQLFCSQDWVRNEVALIHNELLKSIMNQ